MTSKHVEAPVLEPEMAISGPFNRISEPGAFVLNSTGDLLRVPKDALAEGRSPTLDIVSKHPWHVTKISNDPYLPLSKARALTADMDLPVNF